MPNPPPPRADALFPTVTPHPAPGTFELGLVLGGTVSTGAYTAGCLDFLLEALEAWYRGASPPHAVIVKVAGGSSGGAVCASILGLLSNRKVPHVRSDPSTDPSRSAAPSGNPLWDVWVEAFAASKLTSDSDLDPPRDADEGTSATRATVQHVPALLNCEMIDVAGKALAALGADGGERLPYFQAPFRTVVTIANLRGVPYQVLGIPPLGDFSGAAYVQHDDFAWFAFPNGASPDPDLDNLGKREDEFWLAPGSGSGFAPLETLVAFATASGAMPVGLAARALSRPADHYKYRPAVRAALSNDGTQMHRVEWPQPDWGLIPDTDGGAYGFTAVDGGTFNNDPFTLVHRAMAGLIGRNPQGKSDASRAILMIDPLAAKPKPIEPTGKSLVAVVNSIVGTVVGGARYLTADMELFADEDVFSRFQLVPFHPKLGKVGDAALAGASLFAAAGWCARQFRVHDYMLGRQNMQDYLSKELVLAGDNALFDGWDTDMRDRYATNAAGENMGSVKGMDRRDYFLPVVPDQTGSALPVPEWPTGAFDPADLEDMLKSRLGAVCGQLLKDNGGGGPLPWLLGLITIPGVVGFIASKVVDQFRDELVKAGLWEQN